MNEIVLDAEKLFINGSDMNFPQIFDCISPKREKVVKKYNAIEVFHKYEKMILSSAKKSDIDLIKEVYARTEIFDISNIKDSVPQIVPKQIGDKLVAPLPKEISLPFAACFVKIWEDDDEVNGLFIHELTPEYITGAAYMYYKREEMEMITPFSINQSTLHLVINRKDIDNLLNSLTDLFKQELSDYGKQQLSMVRFADVGRLIQLVTNSLDTLNKKEILVDSAKGSEYYTFKDKSKRTIKVESRKIYYVVNKNDYKRKHYSINPIGHLEYSHTFRVRGHWRRINPETSGKDRNGVYREELKGHTWVKDFIKGDGEFVKKIQVVR
jgi:hypothetical protein